MRITSVFTALVISIKFYCLRLGTSKREERREGGTGGKDTDPWNQHRFRSFQGVYDLRYMGLAATMWVPNGAQVPVLSPNDHPNPSQGQQEGFGKRPASPCSPGPASKPQSRGQFAAEPHPCGPLCPALLPCILRGVAAHSTFSDIGRNARCSVNFCSLPHIAAWHVWYAAACSLPAHPICPHPLLLPSPCATSGCPFAPSASLNTTSYPTSSTWTQSRFS